jgi:F0F1-type ATP synthase delta subunit
VAPNTTELKQKTRPAHRQALVLPAAVIGPSDVKRLKRELAQIEDSLLQLRLRSAGDNVKMPRTSRFMDLIAEYNKLNLLIEKDRELLKKFLSLVITNAPQLHFSFSADPSAIFLVKLITWLRQEINPHVLVTIGLQPNIGAGCMLRSENKYFDFSLKQTFIDHRQQLVDKIRAA